MEGVGCVANCRPRWSKRGSHCSVLVASAMQGAGPAPPDLSVSRVNLYAMVFTSRSIYMYKVSPKNVYTF